MNFQKELAIEKLKKDANFKNIVNEFNLKIEDIEKDMIILYSYLIKKEYCMNCKSCNECVQHYNHLEPVLTYNGSFNIEYVECKKSLEDTKQIKINNDELYLEKLISIELDVSLIDDKNLYKNVSTRREIYQKLKDIYDNKVNNVNDNRGLFIHGSYGTGKSYICGCFAKAFARAGFNTIIAFYPELIRIIKSSIGTGLIEEYIDLLKNADVLFLDDFGGEVSTQFIRDEVLFPILQYRMEHHMLTFMTSNLDKSTLHAHLSETTQSLDETKAYRIEERINALMDFVELKDVNYRFK